MRSPRFDRFALAAILLTAAVFRGGAIWRQFEQLTIDRDAYLGIAENLLAGNGYAMPGGTGPTAYRPPLYPLVLAATLATGGGAWGIAALHVALGVLTVLLTERTGRSMGLGRASLIGAFLVAADPLLVLYATMPMTETLSAFLTVLLLYAIARLHAAPSSAVWGIVVGVVLGLGILCRPTMLIVGGLAAVGWLAAVVFRRARFLQAVPWLILVGAAVTLAPWGIRNLVHFGRPIVTTTHGGYTLLLANNCVFYDEVVHGPSGAVWEGPSLDAWQQALEHDLEADGVDGEIARDRWMYDRALEGIRNDPGSFAAAGWLRFRRFWGVLPEGPTAAALPRVIRWGVAMWYAAVIVAMGIGIVRVSLARREWSMWWPALLMIAAFTAVHLVFWTNARMRAPVVPAICLLAARGVRRTDALPGK